MIQWGYGERHRGNSHFLLLLGSLVGQTGDPRQSSQLTQRLVGVKPDVCRAVHVDDAACSCLAQ